MLRPTLRSPSDLFNKLIREQYRSFHAVHPAHVADHLYNFCVTSIALRDCLFEELGFDDAARGAFNNGEWRADRGRVACTEIGNTMKHWTLRILSGKRRGELRNVETKGAAVGTTDVVNVYVHADTGAIRLVKATKPTVDITLSDGQTADAFELTKTVLDFWHDYFATHGIQHFKQSEAEFFGEMEGDEYGEYEVMPPIPWRKTQANDDAGPTATAP